MTIYERNDFSRSILQLYIVALNYGIPNCRVRGDEKKMFTGRLVRSGRITLEDKAIRDVITKEVSEARRKIRVSKFIYITVPKSALSLLRDMPAIMHINRK